MYRRLLSRRLHLASRQASPFSTTSSRFNEPATPSTPSSKQPTTLTPRKPFLRPATWSTTALHSTTSPPAEASSAHLDHLLRLSALPTTLPPERRANLLHSIQSQMAFVRDIQSVDTSGVEPLRAIADETEQGVRERTIGLAELKDALDQEVVFGFRRRPRRIRSEVESGKRVESQEGGEGQVEGQWDALATAPRRGGPDGRYFIVESKSRTE